MKSRKVLEVDLDEVVDLGCRGNCLTVVIVSAGPPIA